MRKKLKRFLENRALLEKEVLDDDSFDEDSYSGPYLAM